MKSYLKYLFVLLFTVFSFYYTSKVMELSKYNDTILVSINEYASEFDTKCKEGSITEDGIILGMSGLYVNKGKSYSNMKGIGFKKELLEYEESECILNKKNNIDKYIIRGNELKSSVSIVISIDSGKYYKEMLNIASSKNIEMNLLMNVSFLERNINDIENHSNILFKGKNSEELKSFIDLLHNEIFCVKTEEYEIIDICSKKKLNSIKMNNEINKNLLLNIKKSLNKGDIIFIKENEFNLNELSSTINYIKSRGMNIININELLK